MSGRAVLVTVALSLALFGCKRREPAPCGTWTARDARGACLARGWVLPSPESGIDAPGARIRSLAIDSNGRAIAAWESPHAGRSGVTIAEETAGGRWTVRDPAASLHGAESAPTIAAGTGSSALVAWVHAGDASGVFVSERDASGAWHDPHEPFAAHAVEPCAAASPSGEQLLAWCQETAGGWGVAIARRASSEVAWHRPANREDVVSPKILFANQPQVASNAQGDALVAWYQSEGVPLMAYVSETKQPHGAFSHPAAGDHLSANGAAVASDPSANARPALGPNGAAAVVWVQANGKGATPVYLATRDAEGAWTKPTDLGDTFSRAAGTARASRAAFGSAGDLYVVWSQRDGTQEAVFAARRTPDGLWVDSGRDPIRLSSEGRSAYGPSLAVGPGGGVLATWVELDAPGKGRVAARRAGTDRAWEPLEWLSRENAEVVGDPLGTIGPHDRAVVAWTAGARVVFARVE